MKSAIGKLVSSIVGKSMEPSVIQFGWNGGSLYESFERGFESFNLDVVPEKWHTDDDFDGAPESISFLDPDILNVSPHDGYDIAVVDSSFDLLTLALYMSLEGIVSENGFVVVPGSNKNPRCRSLLKEMIREGTIKSCGGTSGDVHIYEVHNGVMVEML